MTAALYSREEIDQIRKWVVAGRSPWREGFETLAARAERYRQWTPQPVRVYTGFPHWQQPGPSRNLVRDGEAVYGNALLFALTGEPAHAGKACEILDAWAHTLERIESHDAERGEAILTTSYSWPAFLWAAGWVSGYDRTALDRVLGELVAPVVRQTRHRNNWLSWGICCRAALALHFQDAAWWAETQRQFADHVAGYLANLRGELQRDLWHAQMGLAPLLAAAEMAWRHGADWYGVHDNLLYRALEYQTPFFLGDTDGWPFPQPPVYEHTRAADGQPALWPMYELAVYHYAGRRGLPARQLRRARARTRPETWNRLGWWTLTHAIE